MSCRLIINADDFGLTRGVNRAICELHQAGVVTSATLMANGGAFDDAVAIAHANPSLGVGCHIVLVDGLPVSDPASISSLLGPDGKHFRTKLGDFVFALLGGSIREEEIALEARAQVEKLRKTGIILTHLDTHKHTHIFPQVARVVLRVAQENSIRAIRNPFEAPFASSLGHAGLVRRVQLALLGRYRRRFLAQPQIKSGAVCTTSGTIGIAATGALNTASLNDLLDRLTDGTWELVCHPGYNDSDLNAMTTRLRGQREIEYGALLTGIPRRLAQRNPPQLIHYGNISTSVNNDVSS